MPPALPTGTVTFLFTDVEGSTRLLHELGAAGYADALAEHRRIVREACASQGGVEVDTQGDAFFVAFPTAPGALAAAGEMTEALAAGPIQVRIGLHTGTPHLTAEGYVGDDVHLAARVAGSGHGGQVLVSSATAALLEPRGSAPQKLSLVGLGEHRLKDIPDAVALFQLGEGSFPPLKTISNTNLPRPASSFVGRERELEEVLARVQDGARLLTLTGPGGSGKTRLAIEAAASLVPEYKAGVFWVGLAALRDPALVTETIAQTLGAKDGLAEHISEREMLLLLDNLEQVVEAAPALSALVSACPNLTLLVTSRELLRVQGEVEYAVPPLAEPEAVALFCERAQSEPSGEIAELCARLDNLPLAVELAAARAKALSPAQILERLSGRLDLLKGGRDSDPRQQTLRATIEWSYDLLSEPEQRLFRRLSVFAGGCTLEAAEEVADADLDTLQSLVEKSLLRFSNERYWVLETIREYAGERLRQAAEAENLQRRHADFFVALAPRSRRLADRRLASRTRSELDNFRAALSMFRDANEGESELRLASRLAPHWHSWGFLAETRFWLADGLGRVPVAARSLRAEALEELGHVAFRQSRTDEARAFLAEVRAFAEESGDEYRVARIEHLLSNCDYHDHDFDSARRRLQFAERTFAALGSKSDDYASALHDLALLAFESRDTREASRLLNEALQALAESGSTSLIPLIVAERGHVALLEGDPEQALTRFLESLRLTPEFEASTVDTLLEVAAALAAIGADSDAAVLLGASDALWRESGAWREWYLETLYSETMATVSARLDTRDLASATARGHAMTLDEAIQYALSLNRDPE
jgi:predicted ATPase/class 3 adenylate cyclase